MACFYVQSQDLKTLKIPQNTVKVINSAKLQNTKSTHRKSVLFQYTRKKQSQKEIRNMIPLKITLKKKNS